METAQTPQTDHGYTRIASGDGDNDVLMALIEQGLNGTQYQIMLLVIRKTWGFNKKEDWISLTQFQKITNKSRRSICKEIKELVNKRLLVRKTTKGVSTFYSIQKDFLKWDSKLGNKSTLGNKTPTTREQKFTPLGNKSIPTKDNITKDNIQKTLFNFLDKFNSLFNSSYRVTTGRTKSLSLRLGTYTEEEIIQAVENMAQDSFYQGKNDRGWKADPDFLLRSDEQIDRWLNKRKRTQEEELVLEAKKIGLTIK